jgi:hypothetical protein
VNISHDNRPLARVTVKLMRNDGARFAELLSQEADASGSVHISWG